MTTFEEEFSELKEQVGRMRITPECSREVVLTVQVQKHCLSKKRTKEVIEKHTKEKLEIFSNRLKDWENTIKKEYLTTEAMVEEVQRCLAYLNYEIFEELGLSDDD